MHNEDGIIKKFNLEPITLIVLDKRQTMLEKLVSLIRISYDENPIKSISGKIRHFYDLYYLLSDEECKEYVGSESFKEDFNSLIEHDRDLFSDPEGWNKKMLNQSPLMTNFDQMWDRLKATYRSELIQIAYSQIPDELEVKNRFMSLTERL